MNYTTNEAVVHILNADGTHDLSFSGDGSTIIPFPGSTDRLEGIATQPDGKVVICGSTMISSVDHQVIARLLANGELDTDFADNGLFIYTPAGSESRAYSVAVQSDGKIVACAAIGSGIVEITGDRAIIRTLPDGSLDPDFGIGGVSSFDTGFDVRPYRVNVLSDGRIVSGGQNDACAASVVMPDGSPDPGFGSDGFALPFSSTDSIAKSIAVAVHPDGRLVLGGMITPNFGPEQNFLLGMDVTGGLDPGFGENGLLVPLGLDWVTSKFIDLEFDQEARIIGLSRIDDGGENTSALLRILPSGIMDASFSDDGIHVLEETGWEMDIQPDGKVLVLGRTNEGLVVSRYLTDATLDIGDVADPPVLVRPHVLNDRVVIPAPVRGEAAFIWQLLDGMGRTVLNGTSPGPVSIDRAGLSSGSYTAWIEGADRVFLCRFLLP